MCIYIYAYVYTYIYIYMYIGFRVEGLEDSGLVGNEGIYSVGII